MSSNDVFYVSVDQAIEQAVEWPVIWDAMTSCDVTILSYYFFIQENHGNEWKTSLHYCTHYSCYITFRWRHNEPDGVSDHQPHDCLLNRLFWRRSKKTSKLCVTGLCAGNSPGTGQFPAQMVSNAENVSIWWRHHDTPDSKDHRIDIVLHIDPTLSRRNDI